jgi:ubiquitin-protein ligase E3 B
VLSSLLLQKQNHILAKAVNFLSQEQQLKIHFNALEGSYALCLTANLVHLVRNFYNSCT